MPFVSESQRRFMFANHPRIAKRWQEHTPKGKDLPEHSKHANGADRLPGGLADQKTNRDYNAAQLDMGRKVEMEHTDDPSVAEEIARDHLEEFPNYYTALDEMEKKLEKQHGDSMKKAYRLGRLTALQTLNLSQGG